MLGKSPALPKLVRVRWAVETPRGGNIYGPCDFFIYFYSSIELQPIPVTIFAHNSSKDAVWCKEDPFGDKKCVVLKFGGLLPFKIPIKWSRMGNYQSKFNSETVRDTRNMSMNHDYETGVTLSESVNKTCVKCTLADKSWWRHFRLAIKPRFLGNHASSLAWR